MCPGFLHLKHFPSARNAAISFSDSPNGLEFFTILLLLWRSLVILLDLAPLEVRSRRLSDRGKPPLGARPWLLFCHC